MEKPESKRVHLPGCLQEKQRYNKFIKDTIALCWCPATTTSETESNQWEPSAEDYRLLKILHGMW